jgi:rSAM/selenodomain-associated transferase 1
MPAALVIFAKAPIPGQVKTRLCPPLTPDEAASLHGSFVLDMLERSGRAAKAHADHATRSRLDRFFACAPSSDHVFFKVVEERHGVRLIDQVGDDLGARMDHAFATIFAMGYAPALLVGTDLPTLPESSFSNALDLLTIHDLVLGPALDGGYFLIGLNRPTPALFTDVAWSTDQVFAQTRHKADALGLKTALLPAERDVDTVDDLRAFIHECGLEARHERRGAKGKIQPIAHTAPAVHSVSKRTAGVLQLLASRHRELKG